MSRSKYLLYTFLLGYMSISYAQDTLYLPNPSFEDEPRHSQTPQGWTSEGFPKKSPPDTGPTNQFRSTTQAVHGQSFLVLITRDDNTWERVNGQLSSPLHPGQGYQLEVMLARSFSYFSQSPIVRQEVNFAFPVKLRIWGSTINGQAQELLAETVPVEHTEWRKYSLHLQASKAHSHLLLEAYYDSEAPLPYPGNLCIDHLSPLVPIDTQVPQAAILRQTAPPLVPTEADGVEVTPSDTKRLAEILQTIRPGEVEQGIYELAIYQRSLGQESWTICVYDDGSKTARRFKRQLKKKIAAMKLEDYLKVDDYVSAFQYMKWTFRPEEEGLGIR